MMESMRLRINLSSILAKKGKRLIGRWDNSKSGGLFDFNTKMMVENYQGIGKYESRRIAMNM